MSNEKLLINDDKSNNPEIKSNNEIEEMAKHCTYYHNGECCADATHICDCDLMCEMFGVFANLENAGYHKQSEGEWIITTPIVMRVWDSDCITCSVCGGKSVGLLEDNKLKYCPHCGARMKGGE